jgi:hypothetical protein
VALEGLPCPLPAPYPLSRSTMGIYDRDYMRNAPTPASRPRSHSGPTARTRGCGGLGGSRLGAATWRRTPDSRVDANGPVWLGLLMLAVAGQVLAFVVPTIQRDLSGAWGFAWTPMGLGSVAWNDLSTWVFLLPGVALGALLVAALFGRLRGIALAGLAALPILALQRNSEDLAAVRLVAESIGLPGGDAGLVAYCGLAYATAAAGVANASGWARAFFFLVGAGSLGVLLVRPELLGITIDFGDFLRPVRAALEAETIELGPHTAWMFQSSGGEVSIVTVDSSAVQSVGKWLQVAGAAGVLVGIVGGPILGLLGLTWRGGAHGALFLLALASFGVLLVVGGLFFWTWGIPWMEATTCAAAAVNHLMLAITVVSIGAMPATAASALLSPRA